MSGKMSAFRLNGVLLSVEDYEHWKAMKSEDLTRNLMTMFQSRVAPRGHMPHWGTGHESIACGVPKAQAAEHAEWCRNEGLVGVEVQPDGNVVTNSPGGRQKYLNARNLVDASTGGSDSKCLRDRIPDVAGARKSHRFVKRT